MKLTTTIALTFGIALLSGIVCVSVLSGFRATQPRASTSTGNVATAIYRESDDSPKIQLCQGFGFATPAVETGGYIDSGYQDSGYQDSGMVVESGFSGGFGYGNSAALPPARMMQGVDDSTGRMNGRESKFRRGGSVPFEQFGYGEYIGPHRTPHVDNYRLRVGDQMEFVYVKTREKSLYPYQLYVGDVIEVSSAIDNSLNQTGLIIRSDGKTSFDLIGQLMCAGKTVEDLQRELNDRYTEFVREPNIVVQVRSGNTPLNDIFDAVDARQGQGGQSRQTNVSPDGTIQLPVVGSVPAIGLTLEEIAREVNARYRLRLGGIEVTPILLGISPRFVYVVGEVGEPGRFELTGPTTALQALALAQGGSNEGANHRQIIVLRRDQDWRLTATKLDLAGALYGKRPQPSDDIWLRNSDIIIVPKKPIQRLSEAVNLYLSNTLYSIFPQQGVAFNFDDFTSL